MFILTFFSKNGITFNLISDKYNTTSGQHTEARCFFPETGVWESAKQQAGTDERPEVGREDLTPGKSTANGLKTGGGMLNP